MKKLFFVSCVLFVTLVSGLAQAQIENLFGVYFDQEGTVNCVEEAPQIFDVFLVLHNPSVEAIDGFACNVEVFGAAFFTQQIFSAPFALNVCDPAGHICANFAEPLPLGDSTWLVHWSMFKPGEETIRFTLEGGFGSPDPMLPALLVDDEMLIGAVDPGVGGGYVAMIGDCTVPAETRAFSSLKALYR